MNSSAPCSQFAEDWTSAVQSVCLAGLLFSMSLAIELDAFKHHFRVPKPIVLGVFSQFVMMPLFAYALAWAVPPSMGLPYRVGLVALGCAPGGSLSNVVCLVAGADLNLSVALTTASHFVAIVMLPLNLWLYLKVSGLATNVCISVGGIVVSALMIALGTFLGLWASPRLSLRGMKLGALFGTLCGAVILIIGFVESSLSRYPVWTTPLLVGGLSILPSIVGIVYGLGAASLVRLPKPQRVTVAIETGVQNKFVTIASITAIFPAGDDRNQALSVPIIYSTFAGLVAYSMAITMWKVFGWSDLPREANLCAGCKRLAMDIHAKKTAAAARGAQTAPESGPASAAPSAAPAHDELTMADEMEAAMTVMVGGGGRPTSFSSAAAAALVESTSPPRLVSV